MLLIVIMDETTIDLMVTPRNGFKALLCLFLTFNLLSCECEDPGPVQGTEKEFDIIDFDRLEIASALDVRVEQSNVYSIQVRGDRRNVDDLDVYKSGSTLILKFDDNSNRNHETFITITMPHLEAANFSAASSSKVNGFESDEELDLYLSGASVCQVDAGYREVNVTLSGASNLLMSGLGDEINAEISGASMLVAFDYPVREADVNVSGASSGKVTVTDELTAVAASASSIIYRGNPSVTTAISGGSAVIKD
ncbi:MAG TPA: head GIN domain-containing protein [Chryseolinea sp.]